MHNSKDLSLFTLFHVNASMYDGMALLLDCKPNNSMALPDLFHAQLGDRAVAVITEG